MYPSLFFFLFKTRGITSCVPIKFHIEHWILPLYNSFRIHLMIYLFCPFLKYFIYVSAVGQGTSLSCLLSSSFCQGPLEEIKQNKTKNNNNNNKSKGPYTFLKFCACSINNIHSSFAQS